MSHSIFLSHNHADKPIVEPVAIKLAEIFGKEDVFYDDWSIQPGDGIIEKVNKGLDAPDFVFYFVTANSLNSKMVDLEWQTALYKASKAKTRLVPVRVDGSEMPPILAQTLCIDMHSHGPDYAISEIVRVVQGYATFSPKYEGFSNHTWTLEEDNEGTLKITINAAHFLKPNPAFLLLVNNPESEIEWTVTNSSFSKSNYIESVLLDSGESTNAVLIRPQDVALKPAFPIRIRLSKKVEAQRITFSGVLHQVAEQKWKMIPLVEKSSS